MHNLEYRISKHSLDSTFQITATVVVKPEIQKPEPLFAKLGVEISYDRGLSKKKQRNPETVGERKREREQKIPASSLMMSSSKSSQTKTPVHLSRAY